MKELFLVTIIILAMFFLGNKIINRHEPKNFKTITITVRENQTLWEIANIFYSSNPYSYTDFNSYYNRILEENRHLQNKNRLLQTGDKIYIKLRRN